MGVKKYLTKLQEQDIKKGDRLHCKLCGREVTINKAGKGPLICCGEPMSKIGVVVEAGFSKYPKGWTNKSVKKFAQTLSKDMKGGPKTKGFFDKCVEKMTGKVENPEGFCAGVKDEVYKSTGWRGKDKPEAEVRKDVKQAKFAVK
jgi:desulfoferrodoxin-like iron-binding protein